jgi:carbamoyltransferase
MYILGVTGFAGSASHDAAAALVKDGRIIVAAEEERFTRSKHARGLSPVHAINFCLKEGGLRISDVDAVAHGWNVSNEGLTLYPSSGRNEWIDATFPPSLFTERRFPPVYHVQHHLAHIAAAFYTSGFSEAACLCVDGQGENEAITLAYANKDHVRIIASYDKVYSLGALYEAACKYSGLGYGVPGKLMGLAPYGIPRERMPIAFDVASGIFSLELQLTPGVSTFAEICAAYLQLFEKTCYPYKRGDQSDVLSYIHFAASVQKCLEDIMGGLVRYLKRQTGSENLVLCGGVALNCTCNGRIESSQVFENIYVPPGANDASCSFGAALEVCRVQGGFRHSLPDRLVDPRIGYEIKDDDVAKALGASGLRGEQLNEAELCERAALALYNGEVIIWCQGRAEFGPRALGGRSILASPCRRSSHMTVNQIKQRELWRPLSPSVIEERYGEFFKGGPTYPADFMLKADSVVQASVSHIPAVTHIDGSARPQAVRRTVQPKYYKLLEDFGKLSGTPILLNTSLNGQGEPIINTAAEALALYMRESRITSAAIGSFFITRAIAE